MKRTSCFLIIVCLLIAISSCKTLNTDLSISSKPLPQSYAGKTDSTTIAAINWRQYFADPLLSNLIDTALINNFDLNMALQRVEIARANVKFIKGELLPKVNFNAAAGVQKFGLHTMDGAGNVGLEIASGQTIPKNLTDYYLGLNSTWEVDIWGKLRNQKKSAVAQYLSSIEGTNFVISNLVAEIAISYFELIALDKELEIIEQSKLKQQEALEIIKFQKEVGRTTELAVQQFAAQLLNIQALEKEVVLQKIEIENKINFLLGRYPQVIVRKKDALNNEISTKFPNGIPSQLLQNRPDIREAELLLQASKFDLQTARASFFPNLSLSAGIGFQAFKPTYLFLTPASLAYSALGNLTAPLINRNALQAQFSTAKANQLQAMYNYQKMVLNGYVEVVNELSTIENLQQMSLLKRQETEVLSKSVEISAELFKTAKASYLEVLIAQQNSLQAQIQLIEVLKRQRIATVKMYKVLGGGWK